MGLAELSSIVTCHLPETTAFLMFPVCNSERRGLANFGLAIRFTEKATSAGVTGLPSQNRALCTKLYL